MSGTIFTGQTIQPTASKHQRNPVGRGDQASIPSGPLHVTTANTAEPVEVLSEMETLADPKHIVLHCSPEPATVTDW